MLLIIQPCAYLLRDFGQTKDKAYLRCIKLIKRQVSIPPSSSVRARRGCGILFFAAVYGVMGVVIARDRVRPNHGLSPNASAALRTAYTAIHR